MRANVNIDVKKPVQEIWDLISDIGNLDQWVEGVSEPKRTSEGEFAPGSTFTSVYVQNDKRYQVSYVLTTYDPPAHPAYRVTGCPQPFFNAVDLKSKGSSTKINQTMELDVSGQTIGTVFLGLGPIARLSMTLKLRKGLKRLKARLEAA